MNDRDLFILLVGQFAAAGRKMPDALEDADSVLNAAGVYWDGAGYVINASQTQRFQSQEPNLSGTAKPAAIAPPIPAPLFTAPKLEYVTLDGWGVPQAATPMPPAATPAASVPANPPAPPAAPESPPAPPPVAPWADPECGACKGTGYNSKSKPCPICKSKQNANSELETVTVKRGKPGKQDLTVQIPKDKPAPDLEGQTKLDFSGGGSSAETLVENTPKAPTLPVAAPIGQSFMTDYMTCDECPSDQLMVVLLPGDQGEATYVCQVCRHTEGFTMEPDDILELKARGRRLPPAVRRTGPDGEEIFHRSDVVGIPRPTKGKRTKKALAVSQEVIQATTAQNQNSRQNSESTAPSLPPTSSEPWHEPLKSGPSTKPSEPVNESSQKIKSLVDSLLSPSQPSLPVNEILAKAELEAVVAGWPKEKLVSKWEDLTKQSYADGMNLGRMADEVVNGMLGVH
jgi:hypothetical protein